MTSPSITIEQLIAYASGDLKGDEAAAVAAYVRQDPQARATVQAWRSAAATLRTDDTASPSEQAVSRAKALYTSRPAAAAAPRVSWLEIIDRVLATLVFDSRSQPAMAGFRGTAEVVRLSFTCELGDVDLEVLPPDGAGDARSRVIGQMSPTSQKADHVALCRQGTREVAADGPVLPDGTFELLVEPGVYDLLLHVAGRVLTVPSIDLT